MAFTNIIPQAVAAKLLLTWEGIRQWTATAARLIGRPPLVASVTVGDESANVRRFTVQVTGSGGATCSGCYVVLVWVATTSEGAPNGSQTVSIVTGSSLLTVSANKAYLLLTANNGALSFDVDAGSGAQTRYIRACVMGPADKPASDSTVWT